MSKSLLLIKESLKNWLKVQNNDEYVINGEDDYFHLGPFIMGQIRDKKLLQKIAIVIKKLREDRGLTQEDVYNDTNIHVGRIETASANVTVSTLAYLSKYFKIKLSDIFIMAENI